MSLEDLFDDNDDNEEELNVLNQLKVVCAPESTTIPNEKEPKSYTSFTTKVNSILTPNPDDSITTSPTSNLSFHMRNAKVANQMWEKRLQARSSRNSEMSSEQRLQLLRKFDENYSIASAREKHETNGINKIAGISIKIYILHVLGLYF